jgi:biopolymer transport protein ExbD
MQLPADTNESDGPNLTPVIDIVFLLLIFFLVATTYEQEERDVDIDLPEVAEAQPQSMTRDLIININQTGTYTVVKKQYNSQELLALIGKAHENNPQQLALIRGDGETALKNAVRVMGLCNKVGMTYKIAALQTPTIEGNLVQPGE